MSKNLLIVESPAKAKTIEKFLGKDFTVRSSYGHIRDLEKNDLGVDVKNGFRPNYIISPDKLKVVKELKDLVKSSEEVWLATDEDREGEAISWHLCEVLGLNVLNTKRIVFHEITKNAIQKAVQTPRTVNLDVVNAQQARRVLDRLVGFELSETLWKKIKGKLSAGRVQSVAVKLIVEREREIQDFKVTSFFRIVALFQVPNSQGKMVEMKAESPLRFDQEGKAEDFLKKCIGAVYKIANIEVKPVKRKPAPPFTTSTLQQEASRKLGFAVNRTMQNAQRLYEAGFITYMRTDSTSLSEGAIQSIAQEIETSYGKQYVQTRRFKTSNESAQEAHEAIRPSYIDKKVVTDDRDQQRLYELIWKRTIASQMSDAEIERTIVDVNISTLPDAKLVAEGEVLKFDGFLKVYLESKDEEDEDAKGMLPPLKIGQVLGFKEMQATEKFTKPAPRYTEAGLVKQLEELGIGRPSTYAPTITKIMEEGRGYVVKESREGTDREYRMLILDKEGRILAKKGAEKFGSAKNHLFPTDMGMMVCDFLDEHFKDIMNYGFTADIERKFDEIALGKQAWPEMIRQFYTPFHQTVETVVTEAARAVKERILGVDPVSGRSLIVRMSRLGKPVVQIGSPEELGEDEKPQYANLKPGQNIETIEFDDAIKLFELPKTLGTYEGSDVIVASGRFGPYVKVKEIFVSLPKGEDPMEVTLERALDLYAQKMTADAPIAHYEGLPVTKGKGRFGPFVKWKDLYVNVPRKIDIDHITEKEAIELIQSKEAKEANRFIQHWETDKISIENGRWGPFIRFGKIFVNLPKVNGAKMTSEEAGKLTLEEVKALITEQYPDAFAKKKKK